MESTHTSSSRRIFVKSAVIAAWAALVAAAGIGIGAMLRMAGGGPSPGRAVLVNLGRPRGLAKGQVRASGGAALVRDNHGYFALKLTCPHLGCRPAWDQAKEVFLCPCHGSSFALNGARLAGPANRGLAHLALAVDSRGEFIADAGRTVPPDARVAAKEKA